MVPLFFSMLSQQLGSLKQPKPEPPLVVEEEVKKPKEAEKTKEKIAEPIKDKKKILRGKPSTSKKPESSISVVKISEPETRSESIEEKPTTNQDVKPDLPAEENVVLPEVSEIEIQPDVAPELVTAAPEPVAAALDPVAEVEDEVVKETVTESESFPFSSPISNIADHQQLEQIKASPPNEKLQDYQGIKLESLPTKAASLEKPEMKTETSTAIDNFEWKFDDEEEIGSTLESRYRSSGRGEVVTI